MDISKQTRPLLFIILEYASMISTVFFLVFPATFAVKTLYISAAVWLLFTFINKSDAFADTFLRPSPAVCAVYIWVIFRMFCALFSDIPYLDTNYFAAAFVLLFSLFYIRLNDRKMLKIIFFTAMSAVFLTIIFSVKAQLAFSGNIIRKLATSFKDEYDYTGVAGYSWTYGLLFLTMAISGAIVYWKNINANHLIGIIIFYLLCIFSVFIFSAQYMIAVFLIMLGLLFYLARINCGRSLFLVTVLCAAAFVIFLETGILRQLMIFVGNIVPVYSFKERILGMVELFDTNWQINAYTEAAAARLTTYIQSIKAFIGSPVVGMLNGRYKITGLYQGGDSAILGELARFGLAGSLPLFASVGFMYAEIRRGLTNEVQQKIFFVCMTFLILFSLVNTSFTPTIMFFVFGLVPIFLKLVCSEEIYEGSLAR